MVWRQMPLWIRLVAKQLSAVNHSTWFRIFAGIVATFSGPYSLLEVGIASCKRHILRAVPHFRQNLELKRIAAFVLLICYVLTVWNDDGWCVRRLWLWTNKISYFLETKPLQGGGNTQAASMKKGVCTDVETSYAYENISSKWQISHVLQDKKGTDTCS